MKPVLPPVFDITFEGFTPEAFAILDRLKANPHIEQYRREVDGIRRFLLDPFKRYRDDLVVNWILPNRIDLETERNVFSRLLKNDFGAGGCNHHLWMAFYRKKHARLTDYQVVHSISPEGFDTGLYVGPNDPGLVKKARLRMVEQPGDFLGVLNPMLETGQWIVECEVIRKGERTRFVINEPIAAVPRDIARARGIWIGRSLDRESTIRNEGALIRHGAETMTALWPVYSLLVEGDDR